MTREEVYDKCKIQAKVRDGIYEAKMLLMPDMIDAIIDCAVEETLKRIRDEVDNESSMYNGLC